MKYSLTGSQITRGPTMPAATLDRWQRKEKHTHIHLQEHVIFSNLIWPEFGKKRYNNNKQNQAQLLYYHFEEL